MVLFAISALGISKRERGEEKASELEFHGNGLKSSRNCFFVQAAAMGFREFNTVGGCGLFQRHRESQALPEKKAKVIFTWQACETSLVLAYGYELTLPSTSFANDTATACRLSEHGRA